MTLVTLRDSTHFALTRFARGWPGWIARKKTFCSLASRAEPSSAGCAAPAVDRRRTETSYWAPKTDTTQRKPHTINTSKVFKRRVRRTERNGASHTHQRTPRGCANLWFVTDRVGPRHRVQWRCARNEISISRRNRDLLAHRRHV